MTRAAIYTRVSSERQAAEDKTSLAEQVEACEEYSASRGYEVVAHYQDVARGWSKNRPEFQRMLADARKGRFDTIVGWKADRLSRGMYPAAALMEIVEGHGITLEAVMDSIDMKTFGLMAAVGKIELDNFRERATMGKRGKAKQGLIPTSRVPFGYRVREGRPEVVEHEAEIVRACFRMYRDGKNIKAIASVIPLTASYIHRMLRNESYIGVWHYGRERVKVTEAGVRRSKQPEESWIEIELPQIVDADLWERVQARKDAMTRESPRNFEHLLSGVIRCACGATMTPKSTYASGKRYKYYYCKSGANCRSRSHIPAAPLEAKVWDQARHILEDPETVLKHVSSLRDDSGRSEAELTAAERALAKVQTEEDRLVRLYVNGDIDEEMLTRQRKFITERLESARARVKVLAAERDDAADLSSIRQGLVEWAEEVSDGLDELTASERNHVVRLVFDSIVIERDNSVTFSFDPVRPLTL